MAEQPYDYTQEDHIREVERALMYIEQAQFKCEQIAAALAKDGAEERLINGLATAASALKAEHNRLLNTSHFPVPDEPEPAAEPADSQADTLLDSEPGEPPTEQQRMAL